MTTYTRLNIEAGKIYVWLPEQVKGMDGHVYDVYTLQGDGRGWSAKMYFTPKEILEPLKVMVLPPNREGLVRVKLLNGNKAKMYSFAKRPYVKKDGTFSVISSDYCTGTTDADDPDISPNTFRDAYGFSRLTKGLWERDIGEKKTFVEEFYGDCVRNGFIKRNEKAVLGEIYVKKGQLVVAK